MLRIGATLLSTDITKLITMKLTSTDMRTIRSKNKANTAVKIDMTYIIIVNRTDEINLNSRTDDGWKAATDETDALRTW